jgi:hypothetical protein
VFFVGVRAGGGGGGPPPRFMAKSQASQVASIISSNWTGGRGHGRGSDGRRVETTGVKRGTLEWGMGGGGVGGRVDREGAFKFLIEIFSFPMDRCSTCYLQATLISKTVTTGNSDVTCLRGIGR